MKETTALFLIAFFFTKPPNEDKAIVYKNLISGAIAGAFSRSVTAPIDRIKVFRQVTGYKYNSIIALVQYLHSEGGILSFWRGNFVNMIKVATESALKFTIYEEFKQILQGEKPRKLSNKERFLAASMTGAFCQTLVYPIDTMKLKMVMSKTNEYSSLGDEIKQNYKQGGIYVFYRGLVVNLIGVIPFYGIELSFYEVFKALYSEKIGTETPITRLYCASLSTALAQIVVYPLTVLRCRRQALPANFPVPSLKKMIIHIYKTTGMRTFYCGLLPALVRGVPAGAINYFAYEQIRLALGVKMS